jgi:acyl-coenzyme A synthetase/AMP-(fatty) acid ligase
MAGESMKDLLAASCLIGKEKKAISFLRRGKLETEISYLQLHQDSNRLAHELQKLGVQKTDRVILWIQKSLIFVIAHLALQKIGATSVPLNPGFKKSEMDYLVKDDYRNSSRPGGADCGHPASVSGY